MAVGSLHRVVMCFFHLQGRTAVAPLISVRHVLKLHPEVLLRGSKMQPQWHFVVFVGHVPRAVQAGAVLIFVGCEKPEVPERIVGV